MTPAEQAAADADAKKTADATAASQKAAADAHNAEPVIIEGDAKLGGPFTIHGEGFGMQGALTIGGQLIKTTRWVDRSIKGVLPAGLVGDITLALASGVRHGKWPHVKPVVTKTTTTTVETK